MGKVTWLPDAGLAKVMGGDQLSFVIVKEDRRGSFHAQTSPFLFLAFEPREFILRFRYSIVPSDKQFRQRINLKVVLSECNDGFGTN
jgi:hypothetical protein